MCLRPWPSSQATCASWQVTADASRKPDPGLLVVIQLVSP